MSGSISKFWWNGQNYDVKSSADFSQLPESTTEGIATSGKTLYKDEKQVASVESVELIVDKIAERQLREDARNKVVAPMGFEEEDGRVKNATGRLQIGNYSTMESTLEITMVPEGIWDIT
jgi:hypothetical protein